MSNYMTTIDAPIDDLDNIDNTEIIDNLNDDELFNLLDLIDYDKENKEILDIEKKFKTSELNKIIEQICPVCKTSDTIVEDTSLGIYECIECGTVIANVLDDNPEWKQYQSDNQKDNNRCSFVTNHFLPQSSLGTTIAGSGRNKLKILHSWTAMPYRERSLHLVLKEIQNKCQEFGIIKCIEDDAKILYKNISEYRHDNGKQEGKTIITRGANRRSLIAACIFFACKRKGNTRSPKEIARMFNLKYKDVTKGCKKFLILIKKKKMTYDVQSSNPEHFISRYCRELNINNMYLGETINLAKNIQKLKIASTHTPFSIATGSILLIAENHQIPITKKMIAAKFKVSEVTINKAFKKLQLYKDVLYNNELVDLLVSLMKDEKNKQHIPSNLVSIYKRILDDEEEIILNNNQSSDNIDDKELNFLSDEKIKKYKNITISDNVEEYINYINTCVQNNIKYMTEKHEQKK